MPAVLAVGDVILLVTVVIPTPRPVARAVVLIGIKLLIPSMTLYHNRSAYSGYSTPLTNGVFKKSLIKAL